MTTSISSNRRLIRVLSNPDNVYTKMYNGVEHVVVPVIALVGDSVIQAQGSIGPELVPSVELAQAPWQWNQRFIFPNHPEQLQTANTPEHIESKAFGIVFNSRFEDDKLKMDAYLNPVQAEKVGADAVSVIDRCRQGLQVEVSVGAAISIEIRQGITSSGIAYDGVWGDIISDHLAMLPEGAEGACNNNMGCGAPRAATTILDNSEDNDKEGGEDVSDKSTKQTRTGTHTEVVEGEVDETKSTFRRIAERVIEHFKLPEVDLEVRASEDASFSKIYNAVWEALMDLEPGFDGVYDLFDDYVVYAVYLSSGFHLYRRDYTYNESTGEVSFRDAVEVQQVVEYKVIAAKDSSDKPCGCKDKDKSKSKSTVAAETETNSEGSNDVADTKDAATDATPAAETPVETKVEETPTPTPPASETETVQLSKAEYDSMKEALSVVQAQQAVKKTALVTRLNSATVQTVYDQSALEKMSVKQLEEVARLCRVDIDSQPRSASTADYSGLGLPSDSDPSAFVPAPDSYRQAIKDRAALEDKTKTN